MRPTDQITSALEYQQANLLWRPITTDFSVRQSMASIHPVTIMQPHFGGLTMRADIHNLRQESQTSLPPQDPGSSSNQDQPIGSSPHPQHNQGTSSPAMAPAERAP